MPLRQVSVPSSTVIDCDLDVHRLPRRRGWRRRGVRHGRLGEHPVAATVLRRLDQNVRLDHHQPKNRRCDSTAAAAARPPPRCFARSPFAVASRRRSWRAPRRVPRLSAPVTISARSARSAKARAPSRASPHPGCAASSRSALKVAMKMPIPAIGRTTTRPITISRILRQRMEDLPLSWPPLRRARRQRLEAQPRARAPHARQQVRPHRQPAARQIGGAAHACQCSAADIPSTTVTPARVPDRSRHREWARPARAPNERQLMRSPCERPQLDQR